MQVRIEKNIFVETVVEIDKDDILRAFAQEFKHSTPTHHRRMLSSIDYMTRIMQQIPTEVIAAVHDTAKIEVRKRLVNILEMWQRPDALYPLEQPGERKQK
jgi:hypothetical protein